MTDIIVSNSPVTQTIISAVQGPPGIAGPAGAGGAFSMAFSWGDATPAVIMTAAALTTIVKTEVVLLTPFDAEAQLSIGDIADHESLFAAAGIDLTQAGTYQSNIAKICSGSTAINLYITLAGNVSAGNGIIFLYFED